MEATDLDEFFSHQLDPSANHMAAFGAKNPSDRGVFDHHWQDILNDSRITVRTILSDGEVVGSILAYNDGDAPEISYWIDRSRWRTGGAGQGWGRTGDGDHGAKSAENLVRSSRQSE